MAILNFVQTKITCACMQGFANSNASASDKFQFKVVYLYSRCDRHAYMHIETPAETFNATR